MTPPTIINNDLHDGFIVTADNTFRYTGVKLKHVGRYWMPQMYFSDKKKITASEVVMLLVPKGFLITAFF